MEIREDWLSLVSEEIVEPERRIVDPHHHFFWQLEAFPDYMLQDLWRDTGSGHRVEQTVFVECGARYRTSGPEALAPVGETEFVAEIAAQAERGPAAAARIGAIVAHANLSLGAPVRGVLEAHLATSDRVRGIRDVTAWDPSADVPMAERAVHAELYADATFRKGFAQLAALGLSYDAFHYHPQTPLLTDLARAFPDTSIVLDHVACPIGIGPYSGRRKEILAEWKRDLSELADCANVTAKLGGLAMPWCGFGWEVQDRPPGSDALVEAHRPYLMHAIEAFGPDRCMFESNFPVDKLSVAYPVVWNAFKKLVADFSEAEKESLFRGTALRVYGMTAER